MSIEGAFTIEDIKPRAGFESRPVKRAGKDSLYRTYLTESIESLKRIFTAIDSSDTDEQVEATIADFLTDYCGLPPLETPEKKRECYERFAYHIIRAQEEEQGYLNATLVNDLNQRMEHQQEIATTFDPIELFDMLRTNTGRRSRFEVRQILHSGAMLYEYEKTFGTEKELKQILRDFWIYIDSIMFPTLRLEDGNLYHRVKQNVYGGISASAIRAPRFEKKTSRQRGENLVPVTYRNALLSDNSSCHVLVRGRKKSPHSALLKTIDKDTSISDTRDVLGLTFFVDHRTNELHRFAEALLAALKQDGITISEHEPHVLRRNPDDPIVRDGNEGRSPLFKMEKFIIDWHPSTALLRRSEIDRVLAHFFSSSRNRNKFWNRAAQQYDTYTPIEIQIGTLADAANTTMEGDSLHTVYKARKASRVFKGAGGKNVLEMLRPKKYFGIDFIEGPAPEAIRRKQEASIGLHRQILDQLEEEKQEGETKQE